VSGFAEYQRQVIDLLDPSRADNGLAGLSITRWSVVHWAEAGLGDVCPLTSTLLQQRGRFTAEVTAQLAAGSRSMILHRWGRAFLCRLAGDADPLVADVALLELAMTTPATRVVPRPLPHPWVWHRDPCAVVLALLRGEDVESVPRRSPVLVERTADGRMHIVPALEPIDVP
jgi:hypothetical protein